MILRYQSLSMNLNTSQMILRYQSLSMNLLLKGLGSGEKSEQGQNWLLDQAAYSITKPAPAGKGKYPCRKTIVGDVDYQWQADLTDMSAYREYNEGYRYILMVIDIFSWYGFAEPLRTKEGKEVSEAFSSIMKRSGRKPFKLQVDLGKEFYNQHFKAMLKLAARSQRSKLHWWRGGTGH